MAVGKYAKFISDRSGMEFPYKEMRIEWNGAKVHTSEFEKKHPQLEPKRFMAEPQGLRNARPDRVEPAVARSAYQALSNKLSTGQPSQYFVQRLIDRITITLYQTPGASQAGKFLNYYYVKRIQDAGAYTNATDVPYRFVPCMVAGLTFYLSQKYAPQRTQEFKLYYEDEFKRALQEDGSPSSSFITPNSYFTEVN